MVLPSAPFLSDTKPDKTDLCRRRNIGALNLTTLGEANNNKICFNGTLGCGVIATHGSSHDSLSNRTTLLRIAPPRCPAPVVSREYHYHRRALYLT